MEVLHSLTSPHTCPHVYGWANNNVVMEHYNQTGRLQNRQPGHGGLSMAKMGFICVSAGVILENLLVLLAVLLRIRLRTRWVYICIANITLSDLLAAVAFVVNLCMSGSRTFHLGPGLWLFREGVLFVALSASIFSLLLIAVERYTTMMKPLHQKSAKKTYRVYALVSLCWLMALAIGFLPLLGWNCVCNLSSCSTLLPLYSKSYVLFTLVIFFIILLTIGVLYSSIYLHVRRSTEAGSTRGNVRSMRLLKTVVSIVAAFMLCWGPLFFLLLVDFFCHSRRCLALEGANWVIALAVLNSAINPVIYSLGSMELRRAIAGLLCCCCQRAGLCVSVGLLSKDTGSTSGSSHHSLRNSFSRGASLSTSPPPVTKAGKYRLSSTTSCLSTSLE